MIPVRVRAPNRASQTCVLTGEKWRALQGSNPPAGPRTEGIHANPPTVITPTWRPSTEPRTPPKPVQAGVWGTKGTKPKEKAMEELLRSLLELEDGAEELSVAEYRRRRTALLERARGLLSETDDAGEA